MVKKTITGANYGLGSWLVQKITGALVTIIFLIGLIIAAITTFTHKMILHNLFTNTLIIAIIVQIFIIALIINLWISMRDVWMDYIKNTALRLILHVLTALWLISNFIYAVIVIWFPRI